MLQAVAAISAHNRWLWNLPMFHLAPAPSNTLPTQLQPIFADVTALKATPYSNAANPVTACPIINV